MCNVHHRHHRQHQQQNKGQSRENHFTSHFPSQLNNASFLDHDFWPFQALLLGWFAIGFSSQTVALPLIGLNAVSIVWAPKIKVVILTSVVQVFLS